MYGCVVHVSLIPIEIIELTPVFKKEKGNATAARCFVDAPPGAAWRRRHQLSRSLPVPVAATWPLAGARAGWPCRTADRRRRSSQSRECAAYALMLVSCPDELERAEARGPCRRRREGHGGERQRGGVVRFLPTPPPCTRRVRRVACSLWRMPRHICTIRSTSYTDI
jgi:hypothetical protein